MTSWKNYRIAADKRLRSRRSAFTLIELLTVISVIGVLASMVLFALFSVQESARAKRTKAQIAKIHELISGRWESYRTRPLPIRIPAGTSARQAAWIRLMALRDLMRMEMPDRISDLATGNPNSNYDAAGSEYQNYTNSNKNLNIKSLGLPPLRSPLFEAYQRRCTRLLMALNDYPGRWKKEALLDYGQSIEVSDGDPVWTTVHQGSECLYMILSMIQDGDTNGLDFFREHEIGDTDGDSFPEILDGWGQPIDFIRWAPGYVGISASTIQFGVLPAANGSDQGNGDPFDPLKVDPRWKDDQPRNDPFALFPLIYSMGADGEPGIASGRAIESDNSERLVGLPDKNHFCVWRHAVYWNDPYHHHGGGAGIPSGSITKTSYFVDNISNHMLEAR